MDIETIIEKDGISNINKDNIKLILGDYYNDLYNFYTKIIMESYKNDYTVFIDEITIGLMQVFYTILLVENADNPDILDKLKKGRDTHTTSSGVMSNNKSISSKIINYNNSNIMLVQFAPINADLLNESLSKIELDLFDCIEKEFLENNSDNKSDIHRKIVNSLNINVFARGQNTLSFYPAYQSRFSTYCVCNDNLFRDLQNRCITLIQDFNVANNNRSATINCIQPELTKEVSNFHLFSTTSPSLSEHTFFYNIDLPIIGYSSGVRYQSKKANETYSLQPFIIFQNIQKSQFVVLANKILSRLYSRKVVIEEEDLNDSICDLVHTFLNNSLLNIFLSKGYNSNINCFYIDKFFINTNLQNSYLECTNKPMDNIDLLFDSDTLFNEEEFINSLATLYNKKPHFLYSNSRNNINYNQSFSNTREKEIFLEDLVYRKNIEELKYSYNVRLGYHRTRKTKSAYGKVIFSEFIDSFGDKDISMEDIAWLLQFIDRSIIRNEIKVINESVVNMMRMDLGAHFILPLRYSYVMPFLCTSQRAAGVDINYFKRRLIDFERNLPESEQKFCGISMAQRLYDFVQFLEWSGQSLYGWDIDLYLYIKYEKDNDIFIKTYKK